MMQQKEIFKKIGAIIAEINEQYQYLSDNPEQLNDLELELFAANSDFLAEHVKVLKKVNLSLHPTTEPIAASEVNAEVEPKEEKPIVAEEEISTPNLHTKEAEVPTNDANEEYTTPVTEEVPPLFNKSFASEIEEPAVETKIEEESQPEFSSSTTPPDELLEEPVTSPEVMPIQEIEPIAVTAEPIVTEVIIPEKITTVEIPVEAVVQPVQTLNDIISAQKAQAASIEPQFNKQPITDLKTAISLNDKLLFIKDLFNGYSLAYSEAIDILNRFDSFPVAETFLNANYAGKNNWAAKQNTVEKFYEFLQRRYTK